MFLRWLGRPAKTITECVPTLPALFELAGGVVGLTASFLWLGGPEMGIECLPYLCIHYIHVYVWTPNLWLYKAVVCYYCQLYINQSVVIRMQQALKGNIAVLTPIVAHSGSSS